MGDSRDRGRVTLAIDRCGHPIFIAKDVYIAEGSNSDMPDKGNDQIWLSRSEPQFNLLNLIRIVRNECRKHGDRTKICPNREQGFSEFGNMFV